MSKRLTKKQKAFADEYLEIGNGVRAALKVYDTDDYGTAGVIAVENLQKPKIIEYLEQNAAPVAKNMVRLALEAENEQVQVNAGKDVLDRAGFKPIEKSQSINVDINAEIDNLKFKEIKDKFEAELLKAIENE